MAVNANCLCVPRCERVSGALHSATTFASLPVDVLLQISEWLSVRDILALRSVNQSLSEVTRNSTIWVSFTRRLNLALSPRQCISSELTLHPFELSVSRALKLEQSWRDYNPLPKHYRFNGHQRILSMKNLPGGKHMVSVSLDPDTKNESVVIWDMNYRERGSHVAIAMFSSEAPLHKLHVRYAPMDGKECLFIAFTKSPVGGRTSIGVAYVTVEVLENLSRLGPRTKEFEEYGKLVPNPFCKVLETRSRYSVGALSLSESNGCPVLAAVHRPRTVVFYFLDRDSRGTLKLAPVPGYDDLRHSIYEIKILPWQNQILVIRGLIGGDLVTLETNPIVFETYDIPAANAEIDDKKPCEKIIIEGCRINGFYVSDAEASWWPVPGSGPCVPMLHELAGSPPPPISIFLTTREPRGFRHYLMIPEMTRTSVTAPPTCIYRLPTGTHAAFEWDEEEQAVIIPGAYRSVVWMRSPRRQPLEGIEVIQLAVYRTDGYTFSDTHDTGHISTVTKSPSAYGDGVCMEADDYLGPKFVPLNGPEDPRNRSMKYPVVPLEVAQAMRGGMQAIQFDEWLGRLCVATTEDTWIHVLDWSL